VLPGLVIYAVSYQFASRSIESLVRRAAWPARWMPAWRWARGTLDALQADLRARPRVAAARVAEDAAASAPAWRWSACASSSAAREVVAASARQRPGAGSCGAGGEPRSGAAGRAPRPALLRQARAAAAAPCQIEGLEDDWPRAPRIRAAGGACRSSGIALDAGEERYLMVVQPLPRALAGQRPGGAGGLQRVPAARARARRPAAHVHRHAARWRWCWPCSAPCCWPSCWATSSAQPLLLLADGVRQVAAGDLHAQAGRSPARDELGGLTRAFADMTQQVADARAQVQRGVRPARAGARTRLQTILDNAHAPASSCSTARAASTPSTPAPRASCASRCRPCVGRPLREVPELAGLCRRPCSSASSMLAAQPRATASATSGRNPSSCARDARRRGRRCSLRGAHAARARRGCWSSTTSPRSSRPSAAQAWAEVARRLAHEIKNPLTPIQLSAERLQHRLGARLEGADQAMLCASVEHHRQRRCRR
jgi:hypothetical protein